MHHKLTVTERAIKASASTTTIRTSLLKRIAKFPRKFLKITTFIVLAIVSVQVHAAKAPIYTSVFSNKAVGGYDVVSYFQGDGVPVEGSKKFSTDYLGAQWLFASQENLDMFTEEPEKFAPKYGGYCAYAMASGQAVKGDPQQYHIHEGSLYLNINKKFKVIWLNDKLDFISKADEQWPQALN